MKHRSFTLVCSLMAVLLLFSACGDQAESEAATSYPPLQNKSTEEPVSTPAPVSTAAPTLAPTADPEGTATGNSLNNSANSGLCLAVEDAGGNYYIYMANKDTSDTGGTLCMTNSGIYHISDDYCTNMIYADGQIFYTVGGTVYSTDVMFTNSYVIYEHTSWIYALCWSDGNLYFEDTNSINRLYLDGTTEKLADENYPYSMLCWNDTLYYVTSLEETYVSDNMTVSCVVRGIDTATGSVSTIVEADSSIYSITQNDEYIYITTGKNIYTIDAYSGEVLDSFALENNTTFMNAYDGWIYCNIPEENAVIRISLDDMSNVERIAQDAYSAPYAISVSGLGGEVIINYIAAKQNGEFGHFIALVSGDEIVSGALDDLQTD